MNKLIARYRDLTIEQIKTYKNSRPNVHHVSNIIDEETCLYLDQKLIAVYKRVSFETLELLKTCHHLKFEEYRRTNGMLVRTIGINSVPRNPLRDNICKKSKLNFIAPDKHEVFLGYGRKISKLYREYFSSAYAGQVKASFVGKKRVDKHYLIGGTAFTSAVANKDCALNYHYDTANTKDGISCMIILRGNVAGGELILPELDLGFACQDDFILLFDGQRYLHGVTDIIKASKGYRYTIVYYNNKAMHLCLPPDEELKYNQQWLDRK